MVVNPARPAAVRHGITRALIDYDATLKSGVLSQAGFVTRDAREVERKKVGLRSARRRQAVQQALNRRWLLPQKPPSSSNLGRFLFSGPGLHLLASLAVGKVLNEAASVAPAPDGECTPHGGAQCIALAGALAGRRGGARLLGLHMALCGVRIRSKRLPGWTASAKQELEQPARRGADACAPTCCRGPVHFQHVREPAHGGTKSAQEQLLHAASASSKPTTRPCAATSGFFERLIPGSAADDALSIRGLQVERVGRGAAGKLAGAVDPGHSRTRRISRCTLELSFVRNAGRQALVAQPRRRLPQPVLIKELPAAWKASWTFRRRPW